MNQKILLPALAALLCSCAVTSIKQTWKSPDCKPPAGKVAVLTIEDRPGLRQGFENRFVKQLAKAGSPAETTFDLLSLAEIKQSKSASAERLRASGAEVLLVLRLMDTATYDRQVRPGGELYAPMITGYDPVGWYDYYSVAYVSFSPTYGYSKQTIYLETSLYDLKTEKRLWAGITQTVLKENMDRLAEMDPLVEKILAAMRKDGAIR
jgi:hypothetical protein